MSKKINQINPIIYKSDVETVNNYLNSDSWLTEHQETRKLENSIKEYTNRKFSIAVPNGTIAIYLSLLSKGIKKGSRVGVPNITMIATVNAVLWAEATPVLIDVDESRCMSFESLKKTKNLDALIYVPLNGRGGDGLEIEKWCKNNNIFLIEDSAHALGSNYKNKSCGKLGDISIFSFTPHKIITMGQGGMILTDSKALYNYLVDMKTFNRKMDKSEDHKGFGLNFKITDLQASFGNSQFKKLKNHIKIKREILNTYLELLDSKIEIIDFKPYETPWFIDIVFKSIKNLDSVEEKLNSENIETRRSYPALSSQKYLKRFDLNNLKFSQKVAKKTLWLPSSIDLNEKQIKKVTEIVNKNYK